MISSNLAHILHRFRDIAFDRSKIAIFGYPSCVNYPDGGVPLGRSPYNFYRKVTDGQGTTWRRNIAENFSRLSRAHKRYRRQTDRQTDRRWHLANVNSERELEFTFAKNNAFRLCHSGHWGSMERRSCRLQELTVADIVEIVDNEEGGLVFSNGMC